MPANNPVYHWLYNLASMALPNQLNLRTWPQSMKCAMDQSIPTTRDFPAPTSFLLSSHSVHQSRCASLLLPPGSFHEPDGSIMVLGDRMHRGPDGYKLLWWDGKRKAIFKNQQHHPAYLLPFLGLCMTRASCSSATCWLAHFNFLSQMQQPITTELIADSSQLILPFGCSVSDYKLNLPCDQSRTWGGESSLPRACCH